MENLYDKFKTLVETANADFITLCEKHGDLEIDGYSALVDGYDGTYNAELLKVSVENNYVYFLTKPLIECDWEDVDDDMETRWITFYEFVNMSDILPIHDNLIKKYQDNENE